MHSVRCLICRKQYPRLKQLVNHYFRSHSKLNLVKHLLRSNILETTPNIFKRSTSKKSILELNKSQTLYLDNNFHILCGRDKIIIGDSKVKNEITFNFNKIVTTYKSSFLNRSKNNAGDNRVRIVHRKGKKMKFEHFRINVFKPAEKVERQMALNDRTGEFYICTCKKPKIRPNRKKLCDIEPKEMLDYNNIYCSFCNNYFNTFNYFEHLKSHLLRVYICHICHSEFYYSELLKLHYDSHFEENTQQLILQMEQEYCVQPEYTNNDYDYEGSIAKIIDFLLEPYDLYTTYKNNQITCDMCQEEIYFFDYEMHLKQNHFYEES